MGSPFAYHHDLSNGVDVHPIFHVSHANKKLIVFNNDKVIHEGLSSK